MFTWSIDPFTSSRDIDLIRRYSTYPSVCLVFYAILEKEIVLSFLGRLKTNSKNAIILIFSSISLIFWLNCDYKKHFNHWISIPKITYIFHNLSLKGFNINIEFIYITPVKSRNEHMQPTERRVLKRFHNRLLQLQIAKVYCQ